MPPPAQTEAPPGPFQDRLLAGLREPSARTRLCGWLVIAGLLVGLRCWIAVALPTYIWTRDSGSYITPAVSWLQGEPWVTSARRGPVYSLFIALIARAGGSFATVAGVQQVVGAMTAGLTIAMARAWLGRRAFWPVLFCSFWYALFGLPLEIERLLRNETLLVLFSTVTLGAWFFTLRTGSPLWSAVSGLFGGLLYLLKGIFPMLPLLVIASIAWQWRRERAKQGYLLLVCYLGLYLLPWAASRFHTTVSHTARLAEPEAGEMFYGRTAQWTYLDGGVAADLKPRIRAQVEEYIRRCRERGRLDNNEIVKRTVVPTLKQILIKEQHLRPQDVDRLCWKLGLEAVQHHPFAFFGQVVHDFYELNFITGQRAYFFEGRELGAAAPDAAEFADEHYGRGDPLTMRLFAFEQSRIALAAAAAPHSGLLRLAKLLKNVANLRLVSPVFMTTLLLPVLIYFKRDTDRLFWSGTAVLWYFYLALLATVGRPLDRYLMPVVPITFWAYCTGLTMLWEYAQRRNWPPFRDPGSAEAPAEFRLAA